MHLELIDVSSAIENDKVIPYFQPIVELRTGQLYGFEMLARWDHPEIGPVLPPNFISLAEQTGLIGPMTWKLLRKAFAAASKLGDPARISVNISPLQFRDRSLTAELRAAAQEFGFPMQRVIVEITESALPVDLGLAREIAFELKEAGCRLAMDDFGTGFSSLLHLQSIPFDVIKVDRSFVHLMTTSRESRKIVASIVGLGHNLGMETIGEGVETEEQAEMLLRLGCKLGQGWLYGQPAAASSLASVAGSPPHELHLRPVVPGSRSTPLCLEAMPDQHSAQLQAVYEGAPVGLCFLDRELRYVSVNRRLAEMNGCPIEAHLGRTPRDIVPALFPRFAPYLDRALHGERMQNLELARPASTPGGEERMTLVSYEPAFDEVGDVIGVSVSSVDITDRKRAEAVLRESDERYRSIMETSPIALWVLDDKGNFIDANAPWFDLTGQTREECTRLGFLRAVHPEDRDGGTRVLMNALQTGKRIDIEVRVMAAAGGWRWMRIRGAPRYGRAGKIIRWYGTAEDITERKGEIESLRHLLRAIEKCRDEPGCPGYCHPEEIHPAAMDSGPGLLQRGNRGQRMRSPSMPAAGRRSKF
ncbi:MAG TPA: EAL domain-containing protein [Acidobacteriaceae bacterium]